MPLAWPEVARDVRRVLANRFPHGVLYAVRRESPVILAVMHLRRAPDYWRTRLG